MLMIDIIFAIAFIIVGTLVTTFTLLPVFIIFFFALPVTRRLQRKGLLKKQHNIIRNYVRSATLILVIYVSIYFLINRFFVGFSNAFLMGSVGALFFSFSRSGINKDNIFDYVGLNAEKFTVSDEKIIRAILLP